MESKKWWKSKTLWVNATALVAAAGTFVQTGEVSVLFPALLAVVNVVLRIVTKQPLE